MSEHKETLPKRQRGLDSNSESDNDTKRRRLALGEKENHKPASLQPESPRTSPARSCLRQMEQELKPDTPAFPSIHSRLLLLSQKLTGEGEDTDTDKSTQSPSAALLNTPRPPSGFVRNAQQKLQESERPSTSQAAFMRKEREKELSFLNTIQPVGASAWQKGWSSDPGPSKDKPEVDMSMSLISYSDGNASLAPIDLSQEEIQMPTDEPLTKAQLQVVKSSTPREMSTSAFLDEIFKDALEAAYLEEEEEEEVKAEAEEMEKGESEIMEKRQKGDETSSPRENRSTETYAAVATAEKEKMKDMDRDEDGQNNQEGMKEDMKEEKEKEENKREGEEGEGKEKDEADGEKKAGLKEEANEEHEEGGALESPTEEEEEEDDDELLKLPPSCILSPLSESVEKVVTPLRLAAAASVSSSRLSFQLTSEGLKTPTDTKPLYSIDAYRSQSRSGQKSMQSVTPWRQVPEKPCPQIQPSFNTKEKIKAMKEEAAKLKPVISQTVQALNCCVDEQHGKGSQEEAEAEMLLLVSREKREALLAEIKRLEGDSESREDDSSAPCRGSITISEVHLPLKVDFVCSARNARRPTHFFFVLFRYGPTNIMATRLATAADADGDTISFPALITLNHIRSTFEIDVEVYSMSDAANSFCDESLQVYRKHTKQRVTPRKLLSTLKRSHQQANATLIPNDLSTNRPSKFSLVGCHKITLASLGQNKFPLDKMKLDSKIRKLLGDEFQEKVPFLSPLEGHIHLRIQSEFHSEVEHSGFLTMFMDITGLGAWHRLYFVLRDTCLYYWSYPNECGNKPAEGSIPLSRFKSQSVRPVKMDSCARPFTFELVSRTQQEEEPPLLNKRWFAADNQEERRVWMERLSQALLDLDTWTPPEPALPPAQDPNQPRCTESMGKTRESTL